MKTLIIIPAYNEAKNIEHVVDNLSQNYPRYDYVVVNDGSTDDTAEICRRRGYTMLDLPVNLGIGGGVQTGYLYAVANGYDIAVQFDGDGQHLAEYIADLIAPIESGQADVAIGSRFLKKEGFQSSALRRLGIRYLSGWIRVLCGVKILDVTSGMRAVNRTMIEFYASDYAQDYPEPDAILVAGLRGARVVEVPVQMQERQSGVSSINPVKSVYYMLKVTFSLLLSRITHRRCAHDQ